MTIDYVRLPVSILQIEDLSFAQKIILALAVSLSKGLTLANGDIGKLLNISASQVSNAINDMKRKGYVRIENQRSKYRVIYLTENPKVEAILLSGKAGSKTVLLHGLTGTTSRKTRNITKGTNKKDSIARDTRPLSEYPLNDDGFDRFWSAYPRKVSKDAARRAFAKRNPDAELLEKMLEAIEWQRQSPQWQKDNGQYIPYPASWLNGGRWEDEKPPQPEPQRGDPDWLPTEEEAEKLMAEVEA